jgi:hypothetical protein
MSKPKEIYVPMTPGRVGVEAENEYFKGRGYRIVKEAIRRIQAIKGAA